MIIVLPSRWDWLCERDLWGVPVPLHQRSLHPHDVEVRWWKRLRRWQRRRNGHNKQFTNKNIKRGSDDFNAGKGSFSCSSSLADPRRLDLEQDLTFIPMQICRQFLPHFHDNFRFTQKVSSFFSKNAPLCLQNATIFFPFPLVKFWSRGTSSDLPSGSMVQNSLNPYPLL